MADEADHSGTPAAAPQPQRRSSGLSVKLLLLTVLFVMASAILLYVPSIANFRVTWLKDRLAVAEAAAIVLNASDWTDIPRHVQDDLLDAVGAAGLVLRSGGASRLLASVEQMPEIERTADMREDHPVDSVFEAIDTLIASKPRAIRVIGETSGHESLELVMSDAPLRVAMYRFSANILLSSLIISLLTGALLYLALNRMLVRPMRRMSDNMTAFALAPEDASRIIEPSGRTDELGVAEDHLALMQRDLQATLQQQRRLADLGLAVSKINHDLRNLLASAQLFSDRLRSIPDAAVQSFAPKLIGALDRAIAYCQATLTYGRPQEKAPNRKLIELHALGDDVASTLGLDVHPAIAWENATPKGMEVDADPDQLFRVLLNLGRNAIQAVESDEPGHERRVVLEAQRSGAVVTIRVRDSGPGISERAKANLFRAFQGSARTGGTGLGLPIAAELLRAHGGSITLVEEQSRGAAFEIVIPDRPLPFAPLERKRG